MLSNFKYHAILHLIVLCYGLTGIYGDQINLGSGQIVFTRTLLAGIVLIPFVLFLKNTKRMSFRDIIGVSAVGGIVAIHWFLFFESIKVSNVAIGVICMSTTTLFIAFIEPIILKRKLALYELIIGFFILVGISIIFGVEFEHYLGIVYGLISAFCAALFSTLNGKLIGKFNAIRITTIEMVAACVVISILLIFQGKLNYDFFQLTGKEYVYILILGVICTALAFVGNVWLMKNISPFSVGVAINLEPIYTIIIAYVFFDEENTLDLGFYLGSLIILLAVFSNSFIKRRMRLRKKTSIQ